MPLEINGQLGNVGVPVSTYHAGNVAHPAFDWLGFAQHTVRALLHRDIKALEHLLLGSNGYVWVTDFGLAKARNGGPSPDRRGCRHPALHGSERFVKTPVSPRSDVYGLGALYELLTLHRRSRSNKVGACRFSPARVRATVSASSSGGFRQFKGDDRTHDAQGSNRRYATAACRYGRRSGSIIEDRPRQATFPRRNSRLEVGGKPGAWPGLSWPCSHIAIFRQDYRCVNSSPARAADRRGQSGSPTRHRKPSGRSPASWRTARGTSLDLIEPTDPEQVRAVAE